MTRQLRIGAGLALPVETVTSTLIVYGGKGMGKTNLLSVVFEEMSKADLRWCSIDPIGVHWGLRHSADGAGPGVECLILGGVHGDIPIEPTAGEVVADLVADENVNVIIDCSRDADGKMWTPSARTRFITAFVKRLFQRQGSLIDGHRREPIFVALDEAARYIPQTIPHGNPDLAASVSAWEQVVEEGRNIGIGAGLFTQRSARLNKSVAELADAMIAFRTVGPNSIDAIVDWLGEHVPKAEQKAMIEQIRQLDVGTALVVSPGWLRHEGLVAVRGRETFDSSATPKPGERARRVTSAGATVDLAAYRARMAETIERANAENPSELRKQIGELQRHLAGAEQRLGLAKESLVATGYFAADQIGDDIAPRIRELWAEVEERARAVEPEVIRVSVVEDAQIDRLREAAVLIAPMLGDLIGRLDTLSKEPRDGDRRPDVPRTRPAGDGPRPVADRAPRRTPERTDSPSRRDASRPAVPRPTPPDGQPDIGKGERQILIAVAGYPGGVTREQLTVLTGYKRSSRDTYVQRLSAAGLVEKIDGRIIATDAGVAALGDDYEPLPTGSALRDYWLNRLGSGGEAVLLEALIDAYPGSLTGADFDEATPYKRSSRDTYLQRLRARELISSNGGRHRAADTLFDLR